MYETACHLPDYQHVLFWRLHFSLVITCLEQAKCAWTNAYVFERINILVPRATRLFLNYVSCSSGNGQNFIFFLIGRFKLYAQKRKNFLASTHNVWFPIELIRVLIYWLDQFARKECGLGQIKRPNCEFKVMRLSLNASDSFLATAFSTKLQLVHK